MRPDRDDNIHVNVENIAPEMMNMFVKRPDDYQDASLHTPYDVLSVNSVRKETVLKFNFHIRAIFNFFGLASDQKQNLIRFFLLLVVDFYYSDIPENLQCFEVDLADHKGH